MMQARLLVSLLFVFSQLDHSFADDDVLDQLSHARGVCVVLGDNDGSFSLKLAQQSELMLYLQLENDNDVEAVRRSVYEHGLLGSRVFVERGTATRIHLADNIADIVVANETEGLTKDLRDEAIRVLHPGGRIVVGENVIVKPEQAGTDDWPHPYHAADNNPQSTDQIARGPFLTHFMAEPWYAAMPQMTVISGGRIFKVFGSRASARPQWRVMNTMMCMNAYNGTILWTRPLSPNFMLHRNTMIATPDILYFADEKSCKLINALTGEVQDEIIVPAELGDDAVWKWIALVDGILYALVGDEEPVPPSKRRDRKRGAGWFWWEIKNYRFGFGRTVLAINPESKKVLWSHREKDAVDSRGMCMKSGRIFFCVPGQHVRCLDITDGKVVWSNSNQDVLQAIGTDKPAQSFRSGFASSAYLKCTDHALYFAGPQRKELVCVSSEDGRLLWKKENGNAQLVLRDDGVYALKSLRGSSSLQLDPLTGKVLARFSGRINCARATGCVDSIFARGFTNGSTAMFNVVEGRSSIIRPMRPACHDGVVVSNGLLYWGPWTCACESTQPGVICLAPARPPDLNYQSQFGERDGNHDRQVQPSPLSVRTDDWPTYRKDNQRHSYTDVLVAEKVEHTWTFEANSKTTLTAPVAVGDQIFIGAADGVVRSIDANSGALSWTAFTGGPAKYPPSIHKGNAYVGAGDGWIYCFDAARGELVWRFQAAPVARKIPIYGTLSSTWPVGSGVLVDGGVVFGAAGMFDYDGTYVYALDATNGSIQWQQELPSDENPVEPGIGTGVQSHLLLQDGNIYMSGGQSLLTFDTETGKWKGTKSKSGKDLCVFKGEVRVSGQSFYCRPEDSHYIDSTVVATPQGHVTVSNSRHITLVRESIDEGDFATVPTARYYWSLVLSAFGLAIVIAGLFRCAVRLRRSWRIVAWLLLALGSVHGVLIGFRAVQRIHLQQAKRSETVHLKTAVWTMTPLAEVNAIAVSQNTVLVAGVDHEATDEEVEEPSSICVMKLTDGRILWTKELPARPVSFGIAINRAGQVIVSMQDGQLACFGPVDLHTEE